MTLGADDLRDHPWRLLIGGELVEAAAGERRATSAPATGQSIASVPDAGVDDVERAVAAGRRGFEAWRHVPVRQRAGALRAMAGVVRAHRHELGLLDALDSGNPRTAMEGDADLAAELLEVYADWVLELGGRTVPGDPDHLHYTRREPYGVVVRIVPYNHPLMFAASRLAAPLLAGNAVILKAPDQTPLSALRLGELLAPLVPPGALGILSGRGAVVGPALVRHPAVRRIGFIGSPGTGQAVLQDAAATGIKHVTLELGGKNPMVVLPDADPAAAAAGAVRGMNFHWTAGQSCGSTSWLLVHRSRYDEVVEGVVEGARAVRVGDPLDAATEMGSLVDEAQRERVLGFVARGRAEGLELLTGGGPPSDGALGGGAYVAPTVFGRVPPEAELARQEVFGPVLAVTPFDDADEVLRVVNASPLGLTASIWTNDLARAHRFAGALEAGYVWVNTASRHFAGMPFGGVKDSGLGREESVEELLSYTQTKAITVDLGTGDLGTGDLGTGDLGTGDLGTGDLGVGAG